MGSNVAPHAQNFSVPSVDECKNLFIHSANRMYAARSTPTAVMSVSGLLTHVGLFQRAERFVKSNPVAPRTMKPKPSRVARVERGDSNAREEEGSGQESRDKEGSEEMLS